MPSVLVSGTRLAYRVDGVGGRTFLLFSGLAEDMSWWDDLIGGLVRFGRVVRFNYRGHDEQKGSDEPFTLETLSDDAGALLDYLGVQQAVAVGHAYGGHVAQVLAQRYPDRVAAMVICGAGGVFPPQPLHGLAYLTDPTLDRASWEAAFLEEFCGALFSREQPARGLAFLDERWASRAEASLSWTQRLMDAAAATSSATYWGAASTPTLLLYGREDRYGTAENAQDLADRLENVQLVFVDGAGHYLIREYPQNVVAEITEFVWSLEARRSAAR